eukprot:25887_1
MPFDPDSGLAARTQQLTDTENSDRAKHKRLKESRLFKKLYSADFTGYQNIFKVKQQSRSNYPKPSKSNLKPSKQHIKKRFKNNRGEQMVHAALQTVKKRRS